MIPARNEKSLPPLGTKPRDIVGVSISGDLAAQEPDEGSFPGNRQERV
jgi:hypothetical protein